MLFRADFQKEVKRQRDRGRCLHFSNGIQCNHFISAHSIQRSQLNLIAENGHVYRLNADLSTICREGIPYPTKIGLTKTSTFSGFCKFHDNALFEPIDNSHLDSNKEQIALYAYRSICRELFVKENAVKVLEKMKTHRELNSDQQEYFERMQSAYSLSFDRLKHHKNCYDQALSNKIYDDFEYTYFTSISPCSLQVSGQLYPDFDFLGRFLQEYSDFSSSLDLITFFTAPTREGWAFCFGWHSSSNLSNVPYIQSLATIVSEGKKIEDALLRLSFTCCENHAFRISWWDGLTKASQQVALERMLVIVPSEINYLVNGCEGIADWNFNAVHTSLSPNPS
ncbi:MAG: hypothetical protein Q7U77_13650 [Sediminibacterium sp.]|nr:hypothetical protein [Sediminibacterium sp.]